MLLTPGIADASCICVGNDFSLHELSAWMGKQGQLPRKKCGPSALKAFFRWAACIGLLSGGVWWVEAGSWVRIPLG